MALSRPFREDRLALQCSGAQSEKECRPKVTVLTWEVRRVRVLAEEVTVLTLGV